MFKTALLSLVLVLIGAEIYFQVQQGQIVKQVLAYETQRLNESQRLLAMQSYWQKIVIDSPAYRDAYVQLAYIAQALGNTEASEEFWAKVYSLDPNFQLVLPR